MKKKGMKKYAMEGLLQYFSTSEAAKALGVSRQSILRMVKDHELNPISEKSPSGKYYFSSREILNHLQKGEINLPEQYAIYSAASFSLSANAQEHALYRFIQDNYRDAPIHVYSDDSFEHYTERPRWMELFHNCICGNYQKVFVFAPSIWHMTDFFWHRAMLISEYGVELIAITSDEDMDYWFDQIYNLGRRFLRAEKDSKAKYRKRYEVIVDYLVTIMKVLANHDKMFLQFMEDGYKLKNIGPTVNVKDYLMAISGEDEPELDEFDAAIKGLSEIGEPDPASTMKWD